MKNVTKLAILTIFAFLATLAFAADNSATKLSMHLTADTTIAGTKLAAGDYNVFVTRDGDAAKVRVTEGSKEVVNTTANFKPLTNFVGSVALTKTPSNEVVELQSKKLKGALVFPTGDAVGASR